MFNRSVTVGFVAFCEIVLAHPLRSEANYCQSSDETTCWHSYSGPNYSQVVVSATLDHLGIACATHVNNNLDYNGNLDCFAPYGASDGGVMGRAGEQVQPAGPFVGADPDRRIVSMAIEPSYDRVVIHILRSDGLTFECPTLWPLGPNPAIYCAQDGPIPPNDLRSISYVKGLGLGLTGVTRNNTLFFLDVNNEWQFLSDNVPYVAGSGLTNTNAALVGQDGQTTSLSPVNGGAVPQPLPDPLPSPGWQTDPNFAWDWLGQVTPLAAGFVGLLAIQTNCSHDATMPCIKSNFAYYFDGSTVPSAWSGWFEVWTAPLDYGPISIQDGSDFRGQEGELWVITNSEHLYSWIP